MFPKTYIPISLLTGAMMLALAACAPSNTPPVPVGLERFYNQKLTFGPCQSYATTDADAKTFASDARSEERRVGKECLE